MQDETQIQTGDIVKFKNIDTGNTITGIVAYKKPRNVTVHIPADTEEYANTHVYKNEDNLEKVGHTDEYDPQDPFGASVEEALESAKESETVPVRCKSCGELFQAEKNAVVTYGKPSYCTEACGISASDQNREVGQRAW